VFGRSSIEIIILEYVYQLNLNYENIYTEKNKNRESRNRPSLKKGVCE